MKSKKVLAILLAVMMLCSIMSINAFADGDDPPVYYTVTIYLERIIRDSNNYVTSHSSFTNGNPVTVDVLSGSSLKAAVIKACNENPTIMDYPEWTADGQYLTSLDVNSVAKPNIDHFYYDTPTVGQTTYVGTSWMYFNDTPSNIPLTTYVYPSVSLLNEIVLGNRTITLSYEDQTFVW